MVQKKQSTVQRTSSKKKETVKKKTSVKVRMNDSSLMDSSVQEFKEQVCIESSSNSDKIRQRIMFSVVLLGIFSILSGLGLIIAANWAVIPAFVKTTGGLMALAASLVGTSYFQRNGKVLWAEALLFVAFLLVGGNIALIQQSYHLSLSWEAGSLLWWGLSLPLVILSHNKLLPVCSIGLLGFSVWDVIWNMHYMLVVGLMFVLMMSTYVSQSKMAKFLRGLFFTIAIVFLYVGDIDSSDGAGFVGFITTTAFLIIIANAPKNEIGKIRYYNCLFIFVAWRIFLLFWNAYYNLTSIGVLLICFGSILLLGVGLYTYYFKQIQDMIKGLIRHEQN